MPTTSRAARPYVKSLDGMRGFGIWFVLGYHFLRITGHDLSVMGFSTLWMQMFFVQSGYLITQILIDDAHRPFGAFAARFYWRRMLRIVPVYCLFLIGAVVAYIIWRQPADFIERAKYLFTFTYNLVWLSSPEIPIISPWFVHVWSLAVEEQFYLVWPFLVYFLPTRRLKVLLIVLALLAPPFRYWFVDALMASGRADHDAGVITYMFTVSHMDGFAMGAAIPIFGLKERIKRPGRWAVAVLALMLAAGAVNYLTLYRAGVELSITSLGLPEHLVANLQHVWSYSLYNLFFTFYVLHVVSDGYRGLLNHPALVRIGKVTYGMYVFHMPLLVAIGGLVGPASPLTWPAFLVGCAMTWGLADVSYRYFEKRFLDLKDYWTRRESATEAAR